jgi:cell division protein FtsI (penicillin-binding protein 3)
MADLASGSTSAGGLGSATQNGECWNRAARAEVPAPRSEAVERGRGRLAVLAALCIVGFSAVIWRLIDLSLSDTADLHTPVVPTAMARADIVDRNGELVARDLDMPDIFVKPRLLGDPDAAAVALARAVPQLSPQVLRRRFKNPEFAYILRNATPKDVAAIHELGLPGVEFQSKFKRAYPKGGLLGHVLGYVDIDNRGLAGIERADEAVLLARGHGGEPLRLSLDTQVQFAVRQELEQGLADYGATAAVGIVLDANNGEVYALVSLPDFDPNIAGRADDAGRRNRAVAALYEMGSVFKPFTFATGFETGRLAMGDHFDARQPLKIGRRTIHDYHPLNRILSTQDVFIHSSNIGTAEIALKIGADAQKAYLGAFGLLDRSPIELPETEAPLVQARWGTIESATISYGYGISVAPIQVASGIAALVDGGTYVAPTIFKRAEGEAVARSKVISPQTAERIRELMRANTLDGTGKGADVEGYDVGGKTGTADKEESGGYASGKRVSSFVAVFPIQAPRFVVLVLLDEPTRVPGVPGQQATGGATAAPLSGLIIRRIAPILGMTPASNDSSAPQVADKHN